MNPFVHHLGQIALVAMAVVYGFDLSSPSLSEEPAPPAFNMLAFLDTQVATQEDVKDVRCWSSVSKLQMFLTGAEITPEAIGQRIEYHMDLLESIWAESSHLEPQEPLVSRANVKTVLEKRFPYSSDSTGNYFKLNVAPNEIMVPFEASEDYSDTIEPWRLMQSWAARKAGPDGKLKMQQQFSQESLDELYQFLRIYDLALMQYGRVIAQKNHKAWVDKSAMAEAMTFESVIIP